MSHDLPIYSDSLLRSRLQFADLDRLKHIDVAPIWEKADNCIEQIEGATNVAHARSSLTEPTKEGLLAIHGIVFRGREGAGKLRASVQAPTCRGQDCPPPEFLERSLDNFFEWLTADSFAEIHPIEKAALVLTRIVDVWPFEFGNWTAAIMFANLFLKQAGLPPFFVLPGHMKEFRDVVGQAITIETQPLVNAIHHTMKRELLALAP